MPWNFEIEGDWDDKTQAYDAKPKYVKLDDSEGWRKMDGEVEKNGEPPVIVERNQGQVVTDDAIRLNQLEASMQELFRKIHALEARLGVARDA